MLEHVRTGYMSYVEVKAVTHPLGTRAARIVVAFVGVLLLTFQSAPTTPLVAAAQAAPTRVVLATGFVPNVQFAPYYMAVDRGYYANEGLDVMIQSGANANQLSQLGAGGIDFAITGGDALVPARVAGVPVVYVMGQFQKYPVGAMAIEGNGPPLTSPADLRGRTIGVSGPNGSTYIAMRALLEAGGMTEDDVHVISIGFTELEALNQKRIDLAMTFLTNEPVQARAMGLQVETLEVSPYYNLISTGLATSDSNVQQRPDLVQHFVNASLRGLRDTLADPDAAFAASLARMPEIAGSDQERIQREVLQATIAFEQPPVGHPLGWSDPDGWQSTQDLLKSTGLIDDVVDPATMFTNTFAEQATP
jgi:NitT/TauT family transport system substrate-binding protein